MSGECETVLSASRVNTTWTHSYVIHWTYYELYIGLIMNYTLDLL